MGEKVLVTGGAGFIGSHLVDALLQAGHTVRVFDSLEPQVHGGLRELGRWPDYLNSECERVLGDVRDRAALQKALAGMDVIFHEAAAVGVGQSMYEVHRYVDINTLGTATLLDILANDKHTVRKLMVASSMSIYGEGAYSCATHGQVYPRLRPAAQLARRDWEMHCACEGCEARVTTLLTDEEKPLFSTSIYAISKKDQEEMCLCVGRAYNLPTVALRYFNVYGPRQSLSNPYTGVAAIFSSRLLNNNSPIVYEDGLQSRDFIHVSDIVQANLLAMTTESAVTDYFNVGTGHATTVLDVARVMGRALGKDLEPTIVHKFREGDIRHCVSDISKAQRVLGYQPRVKFENGMQELAEWVSQQQAVDLVEKARQELEKRKLVQ